MSIIVRIGLEGIIVINFQVYLLLANRFELLDSDLVKYSAVDTIGGALVRVELE